MNEDYQRNVSHRRNLATLGLIRPNIQEGHTALWCPTITLNLYGTTPGADDGRRIMYDHENKFLIAPTKVAASVNRVFLGEHANVVVGFREVDERCLLI
jgi:hypothetical protein